MTVKFSNPHPNDGTGPGVFMPGEVKHFLDLLDGEEATLQFAVDELKRTCDIVGVEAEVTAHGDYIGLRIFPHGRGQYPQNNWRAIDYSDPTPGATR